MTVTSTTTKGFCHRFEAGITTNYVKIIQGYMHGEKKQSICCTKKHTQITQY